MKRSNFTFLFLFALLSFGYVEMSAQTSSALCIDANVQIDTDCSLTIDPMDLSPNVAADSIWLAPVGAGTGSGTGIAGGVFTFGSLPPGNYTYELFPTSGQGCWANILIENKAASTAVLTSSKEICCIDEEDPAFDLGKLFPSRTTFMDNCGNTLSTGAIASSVSVVNPGQDQCDTTIYIRTLTDKDGGTVAIDSVSVIPIDLMDDVCKPQGEVDLDCGVLDYRASDDYEPATLAAAYRAYKNATTTGGYTDNPTMYADTLFFPYIKKTVEVKYDSLIWCSAKQKFPTGDQVQVLVETKDGETIWTLVDEVAFYCVEISRTEHVAGTVSCTGREANITLDSTMMDTVGYVDADGDYVSADFIRTSEYCLIKEDVRTVTLPKYVRLDKGNVCNINTKCVDMVLEDNCGQPMIMRSWSMIDWCDKSVMDTAQWIRFNDPDGPGLDFSSAPGEQKSSTRTLYIEPWTCAASSTFNAPTPKGCSTYEWQWTSSAGNVIQDGSGSATVINLWKAESPVRVTATVYKCNGTSDAVTWTVTILDDTPPVMIAEDQVLASLTYDGTGGVAKVEVGAIDAGSHDAGCGEVDACLLLKEEWENPVYVTTYYAFRGDRTKKSDLLPASAVSPVLVGYTPLQCGDPDDVIYLYAVDKFGAVTLTGSVDVNYCKDYAKFCCDDIGDNQVALVGSDQMGNASVVIQENGTRVYGNVNHSWSTVTVEDKSGAGWTRRDYSFDCTQLDADVPGTRTPTYGGVICDAFDVYEISRIWDEQCGGGYVDITWGVVVNGEELTQTYRYSINAGAGQFDPASIRWPLHYTGERESATNLECYAAGADGKVNDIFSRTINVDLPDAIECEGSVNDIPVWCEETCSLVAYSYEDETLSSGDACQKVIRRHTIVDWCNYVPNGNEYADDANDTDADNFELVESWLDGTDCESCIYPSDTELPTLYYRYDTEKGYDADGYYTFDQIIKIVDNDRPEITVEPTFEVAITDGASSKDDDADCSGVDEVTATATDFCLGSEADPNSLSWLIQVRVKGSSTVVAQKTAVGAEATMTTVTGGEGSVHVITWTVKDACGNTTIAETEVTFADKKNPTPVCLQNISTATMNVDGGPVSIWAEDFDLGSFDNCTSDVEVMFGTVDEETGEVSFSNSLDFGCEDIPNGVRETVEIRLYAFDESGNYDYCNVQLQIDDNVADACENDENAGAGLISGEVRTELGDMIESAQVSLNKVNTDMTSVEGKYAFGSNPEYTSYAITSKKDDDYLNGVTTLDLVLIQKHVLGIEALDSPYKVIAADINSDANVSAIDLVELRKLILGVYNTLPSNDSWRFVDATETFADANDPFPFTEALNIAELNGNALNQDFLGVKIGDVSGNAIANSLIAAGTRSAGTLNIEIADATVDAGQVISVPVSASNFSDIAAYQFTMDVSGLEFTGVESGAINVSEENFGLIDANTITTAWNSTAGVSASDVLFTMNFRATAGVTLSEAISVSSRVTTAAAYTANADQLDVNVSFNGVATTEFALFQNEPNPFENVTRVSFELPQAASATLTVFDVTGKVISIVRGDFAQGANTITLDKSDLNASGVMYYQLESGEFTATKKMIVIE